MLKCVCNGTIGKPLNHFEFENPREGEVALNKVSLQLLIVVLKTVSTVCAFEDDLFVILGFVE